ncbi:HAD family hydrolase [Streptomyces sp. NPDC059166]|uniref:HAD family hydrolase n=1 Tax=Streptomyces sp. NPDC059166 TaxID=3346752 RepID=UPI0036771AA3
MSARPAASLSGVLDPDALLESADCVLLDFDGPLCDLFAARPATGVATELAERLPGFGCDPQVAVSVAGDPLALLQAVFKHHGPGPTTSRAEEFLAREEIEAAGGATPTEHARELVGALAAGGWKQAVTTNNTPAAVRRFLERQRWSAPAAEHVHGRGPDPALLKPDPHCLVRALESTGSDAATAVMIGDSCADFLAAQAVGVPFIGYAVSERRRRVLEDVGARCTVRSLRGLAEVALRRARSRQSGAGRLPIGVRG